MILKCLTAIGAAIQPGLGSRLGKSVRLAFVATSVIFSLTTPRLVGTQFAPPTSAPTPSFEVASIKPNNSGELGRRIMFRPDGFTGNGLTVKFLISMAYGVKEFQVAEGPGWIDSQRYDVDAKEEDSQAEEMRKLPPEKGGEYTQLLVQSLLADRFKLKVSRTTKELPICALVIAKNGPKLHGAKPGDTYLNGLKGPDGRPAGVPGAIRMGPGQFMGQGIPVSSLAMSLSQLLGRTVQDQTGLKGNYDFSIQWAPDENQMALFKPPGGGGPPADNRPLPEASGPSIFTALQEQLGLKLTSTKGPVEIILVDHVEQPSEN